MEHIHNTLAVPCKKSKMVSFASSIIKNIVALAARSKLLFLFCCFFYFHLFFFIWVFFHEQSRFTGQQGKGEAISLSPLYHFDPLHRYLDISRVITAESSPLHIASSQTRTRNLWFPSASHQVLVVYLILLLSFYISY